MFDCKDKNSLEVLLMELNRNERVFDLPTEGFESIKYQLSLFDKIPLETQAKFLMDKVDNIDEDQVKMNSLMKCYVENDIKCVSELVMDDQDEIISG
jgi:uncharacterized protein YbaP (TraB family)